MKKMMHARKGGFTLVELLIVIMIVAILAGMMMLATGSATDSAEASKVTNDLRAVKSSALLYYVDYNEWPVGTTTGASGTPGSSLDRYSDRPLFTGTGSKYDLHIVSGEYTGAGGEQDERFIIGIKPQGKNFTAGVLKKLNDNGAKSGTFAPTTVTGQADIPGMTGVTREPGHVYMFMK